MLRELYDSSTGLLERFGVKPTVGEQFAVFCEEVQEFQHEVLTNDNSTKGELVDEATDVIVTVLNTLYAAGISYVLIEDAIKRVIAKNDAKTWDTHFVNQQGKVQRKGRA